MLKLYYLSPNNDSRVRRYIDSRRQKKFEPFLAYLADMELNFKKLSYQVSESEKVQTLRENLNPYFAEKMVLAEIHTMKDFKRYGRQIELMNMMHRTDRINVIEEEQIDEGTQPESDEILAIKGPPNKNFKTTMTSSRSCQTDAVTPGISRQSMKCFNCENYGHHHNQCPEIKIGNFCFGCGERDHTTLTCPKCSQGNDRGGAEAGTTSRH
jgi:hypothetical protein